MTGNNKIRWQSCTRKAIHKTKQAAKVALKVYYNKHGFESNFVYYKCKYCGYYHLGHMALQIEEI
jgi:hypothetical protein